jgi:hypothetical protein
VNEQKALERSQTGTVLAVCTSERKGTRKRKVEQAELHADWGIVGDAHAANWHRQVSLLAWESIEKMRHLRLGDALVEVTQIGKVCHERCAIYYQAGDCVMPREGIFVKVHQGGLVKAGDSVEVLSW